MLASKSAFRKFAISLSTVFDLHFIAVQLYKMIEQIEIVKLNVRGKFFITTKSTFAKYQESHFKHFIRDQNESGVIFIDQDPNLFENILDLFRFGKISNQVGKIEKSMEKFQCTELQEKIELEIQNRSSIDDYLETIANIKTEMEELKSEISDESNVSDFEVLTWNKDVSKYFSSFI